MKGVFNMKNEMKNGVYTKDEKTFEFSFITDLSASKKMDFVNSVVGYVVTDSDYNFVIKDIIFDFEIIHKFTNYNISDIKEADDTLGAIEELLDTTNIVEIVKSNMVDGLYEELVNAVNLDIQYKTGIRNNDILNSVERILDTIEEKVKDIDTKGLDEFTKVFNGISGQMTPDKFLEAFAKSNMYKPANDRKKQYSKRNQGLKVLNQNKK